MKDFKNKLILITGGSSGIGLELAKQLAIRKGKVWILARDYDKLQSSLKEIKSISFQNDQDYGIIQADVTDFNDLEIKLNAWIKLHGTPDLLINSAGFAHPGYFQDLPIDIYDWTIKVNYLGMAYICKIIVPNMMERGSGYVVNISSEAGFIGVFGYTAYCASKYAVRGFTDSLRSELKPHGIGVSIIYPPDTDTPQLAYENQFKPYETKYIAGNSKIMTPENVARIIIKNVEKEKYMVIPGFPGKIIYRISSILKHTTYPIMDQLVANARRKKHKEISNK